MKKQELETIVKELSKHLKDVKRCSIEHLCNSFVGVIEFNDDSSVSVSTSFSLKTKPNTRLRFRGIFPLYYDEYSTKHELCIDASETMESIAQAIESRLLPKYRKDLAVALNRQRKDKEYDDGIQAIQKRYMNEYPFVAGRDYELGNRIDKRMDVKTNAHGHTSGSVDVDPEKCDLHLYNVPHSAVEALLNVLKK